MRLVGSVSLVLIVLAGAMGARAEDEPSPRDGDALIDAGLRLRREHRDSEALEVFRKSVKAFPSPRARAQVALAEQALGQWVAAERDLRDALSSTDDAWIKSHKAALTGALQTIGKHLGTLILKTNVLPAEVFLDGTLVGVLPLDGLRVPAGEVKVELRSKGYLHGTRTIQVAAESTVTEEIPLVAEPASPSPPPPAPAASSASLPEGSAYARESRPPTAAARGEPTPAQTRRVLAWGALGAAGAFLGVALTAQIVREGSTAHYNDDGECFFGNLTREQRCGAYRGQAETAQTIATAGYIASGAFGIASAVLFFAIPNPAPSADFTLRLDVDRSRATIGVGGKF